MKYLKNIWMAAIALMLVSCQEDDKMMVGGDDEIVAPVLNEISNIIVGEESLQNEVTFTWNAASYGYPASVSYKLYAAYNDKEVLVGESFTTSYTLTQEMLNNRLVDKKAGLALPEGKTSTIFFKVVSGISEQHPEFLRESNAIMVEFTSVSSTSAQWIRRLLYVPGAHQGWAPEKAPVIWETSENSNVYEGLIYLVGIDDASADCEFKLCPNPGWAGNFGGTMDALTQEGNPANLKVAPGTYWLSVELDEAGSGKVSATPVTTVGIIGTAVGGWETNNDLVLSLAGLPTDQSAADYKDQVAAAVNAQVWTGVGSGIKADEFKCRLNNAWVLEWGGSMDHLVMKGGNMMCPYEGNVRFSINFHGDIDALKEDDSNPSPFSVKVEQAE